MELIRFTLQSCKKLLFYSGVCAIDAELLLTVPTLPRLPQQFAVTQPRAAIMEDVTKCKIADKKRRCCKSLFALRLTLGTVLSALLDNNSFLPADSELCVYKWVEL